MRTVKTSAETVNKLDLRIQVNDHRLRVRKLEPGGCQKDLPWLVFLHEGLGCIDLWRDFPDALCAAAGQKGMLYDRKGYGGSDSSPEPWPRDYHTREVTGDLEAVLTACEIDSAILIGHSDGGTMALIAAARFPERIKGVITEAAHIFVDPVTLDGIRDAVAAFRSGKLREKLFRYHGPQTDTMFYRWADRWLDPSFADWNIDAELHQVTCPVLVLQGEDDPYGEIAQIAGIAEAVCGPAQTRLIPNCGHIPHHQARDRVLGEMLRFIKGCLP